MVRIVPNEGGTAMTRRAIGIALTVVGLLVGLLSVLADVIGLGGTPGYGRGQIVGTIVGAAILIVGVLLSRRKGQEPQAPTGTGPEASTGA